ncbi:hypothetical protein [Histidinibacterium aquaticum]|uniref:Uncharacterized protein n=1 Tax=Histidinibacterium aquaticum TaxID=2613962 RepID=A0A5J5GQ99_9RHOB|nr:hypothetical protein [Histidinibacterium aquaticum]KAA9009728.1 hypothetical protein F3S47_00180 [Histidinibacterium aquaticum]
MRFVSFSRIAPALILAAGSAAAQAPAPEACVPMSGDEALSEVPQDLGQGFVAQAYTDAASEEVPDPFVVFTECESGFLLIAAQPELPNGERRTSDEIVGFMQEALASEVEFSGQDIAFRLTANGAPAQVRQSERQNCGCAAFYPDAGEGLTPWQPPE